MSWLDYRRSGFDHEIRIASFFWSSQSKESQSDLVCILLYGIRSTTAIVRVAIWPDKPKLATFVYCVDKKLTIHNS